MNELKAVEKELGRKIDGVDFFSVFIKGTPSTYKKENIECSFTREEIIEGKYYGSRSSFPLYWFIDNDGLKKYISFT